jgi:hypothetical protein
VTVEDKKTEGYNLQSKTNTQAVLVKRTYGKALWHIVILILTVWWTLGIGNLLYLLYSYFGKADVIEIKIDEDTKVKK